MQTLVIISIVVIFVLYVVCKINAPKIKGVKGEARVANRLKRLSKDEFKVFNDITISTSKGSSQIDHVVVSVFGIFVIETKNYTGWIFGSEKSEYWTQTIYGKKTKFRNPIRQNWGHVYALKEVLSDFKQVSYHPIIVFAGRAELKYIYSTIPVIYGQQLIRTIKDKSVIPKLSIEQVDIITERILESVERNRVRKKDHVRQVRKHTREKKQMEKALLCTRCGGELVLRNGKYGKFYACSNYPKCKYTRKYGGR